MGGTRENSRGCEHPSGNVKSLLSRSLRWPRHFGKGILGGDLCLRRTVSVGLVSGDHNVQLCEELIGTVDQSQSARSMTQLVKLNLMQLATSARIETIVVNVIEFSVVRSLPQTAARRSKEDLNEPKDYKWEIHHPYQVVPITAVVVAA
jgi:hypothetical protein